MWHNWSVLRGEGCVCECVSVCVCVICSPFCSILVKQASYAWSDGHSWINSGLLSNQVNWWGTYIVGDWTNITFDFKKCWYPRSIKFGFEKVLCSKKYRIRIGDWSTWSVWDALLLREHQSKIYRLEHLQVDSMILIILSLKAVFIIINSDEP